MLSPSHILGSHISWHDRTQKNWRWRVRELGRLKLVKPLVSILSVLLTSLWLWKARHTIFSFTARYWTPPILRKALTPFSEDWNRKYCCYLFWCGFGLGENIVFGQVTKLNNPMKIFGLDFGPSWPFQSKIQHIRLNCLKWPDFGRTGIVVKKISFVFFFSTKKIYWFDTIFSSIL